MNTLKQIRQRFPGFERSMGRAIHELVIHEAQREGHSPKRVHGWIEVRPANPDDPLAAHVGIDWIAYLHAHVMDGETYMVPVIPDKFNPRPNKIVKPDDPPHVFQLMHEAEQLAKSELPGFVAYIESKLP